MWGLQSVQLLLSVVIPRLTDNLKPNVVSEGPKFSKMKGKCYAEVYEKWNVSKTWNQLAKKKQSKTKLTKPTKVPYGKQTTWKLVISSFCRLWRLLPLLPELWTSSSVAVSARTLKDPFCMSATSMLSLDFQYLWNIMKHKITTVVKKSDLILS